MTEEEYAEGSGSKIGFVDSRLRPGAEVLVGRKKNKKGYEFVVEYFGTRQVVQHCAYGHVRLVSLPWDFLADELLVLKTADGELTDEGKWLDAENSILVFDSYLLKDSHDRWNPPFVPVVEWARRAGILVDAENGAYKIDVDRFRSATRKFGVREEDNRLFSSRDFVRNKMIDDPLSRFREIYAAAVVLGNLELASRVATGFARVVLAGLVNYSDRRSMESHIGVSDHATLYGAAAISCSRVTKNEKFYRARQLEVQKLEVRCPTTSDDMSGEDMISEFHSHLVSPCRSGK